jgi:hypothetical protein
MRREDVELKTNLQQLPCYIDGEFIWNEENKITVAGYEGINLIQNHQATTWMREAAIETASRVQPLLAELTIEDICSVLGKTMDYYFDDDAKFEVVTRLTGSPITYVRASIGLLKDWCRNIKQYYDLVIYQKQNQQIKSTYPIFAILPSNSEEESLYIFAQALLSRNSLIIRSSSKGASVYSSIELIIALNKALDEISDSRLNILRRSISIVNTPADNYLQQFFIDRWNYIVFGDDDTLRFVKNSFRDVGVTPRKIIAYGTGLSISIILDDCNLERYIPVIAQSICVNAGNECVSTDIIYVDSKVSETATKRLSDEINRYRSCNPTEKHSIGIVNNANKQFILNQLTQRCKTDLVKIDSNNDLINATIIPLHRYESAIEYPGPIASIRVFEDINELTEIIKKDLNDNSKAKNLVASVFTESDLSFKHLLPYISAFLIKHNKPTHDFNPMLPHQGIYLIKELVDTSYLQ